MEANFIYFIGRNASLNQPRTDSTDEMNNPRAYILQHNAWRANVILNPSSQGRNVGTEQDNN